MRATFLVAVQRPVENRRSRSEPAGVDVPAGTTGTVILKLGRNPEVPGSQVAYLIELDDGTRVAALESQLELIR